MKNQLDELMIIHNLDAMIIAGPGDHNPAMMYMTGGGHFDGVVIKPAGLSRYCIVIRWKEKKLEELA